MTAYAAIESRIPANLATGKSTVMRSIPHDGAAMRLVSMLKRRQSCVNFHRVFYEQRSKFYARNAVMPLPVTVSLFTYLLPVARSQRYAHKVRI